MSRRMQLITVVAAVSLVALLSACSSSSSSSTTSAAATTPTETSTSTSTSSSSAAEGTAVAVTVGETDVQHMYMKVDPASVAAGTVTFTVVNEGVKKHEFVVLQTDANPDKLTVEGDEVVEDDYDSPGEIGDLPAGATDTLTLDLPAGKYVLICNLKGHYRMGMYTPFTVT
jgi:uncharacterized cupredoxin-like copper-binding protein